MIHLVCGLRGHSERMLHFCELRMDVARVAGLHFLEDDFFFALFLPETFTRLEATEKKNIIFIPGLELYGFTFFPFPKHLVKEYISP